MEIKNILKYVLINILLISSLAVIFLSCSGNEPEDKSKKFGIYLFQDGNVTWESLKGKDLYTYKLKEWITGDKIDFYDYSTHVIYLNVDYNTLLNFPHNGNTPFVVVANDKRIYYGRFGAPQDTTEPHVILTPMDLCTDLIMLEFNPGHRKDIRESEEIKSALKAAGKFKPGIGFDFIEFRYLLGNYGKTDTNYFEIDFYLHIFENECVYPVSRNFNHVKVGNKIYITRLVIYNQTSYYSLPSVITQRDTLYNKEPKVLDSETDWYYLYFYRTYQEKYYSDWSGHKIPQNFPEGKYYCYAEYYGMMGGKKEYRTIPLYPGGRIWMGYKRTNTIEFEYSKEKGINVTNTNVLLY